MKKYCMTVTYKTKWGWAPFYIEAVFSDYKNPRFYTSFTEATKAYSELIQKLEDSFGLGFHALTEKRCSNENRTITVTDYNWYELFASVTIEEVEG